MSPGINVVFGPNASGKTTTARALTALLWPERAMPRDEFAAGFVLEGTNWHVELHGRHAAFQCNHQHATRPSLPAAEALHGRCNVALHDLLQIGDNEIGRAILLAAAGDCDLDGAASALDFDGEPRFKRNAKDSFHDALREVRRIGAKLGALADESARLVQLDLELQAAKTGREQAALLAQAIEKRQHADAHALASAALAQFDARLEKLTGTEATQLAGKQGDLDELRKQQDDAQDAIEIARRRIVDCRLPEDGVAAGQLTELRTRLDGLRTIDDEIARLNGDLAAARTRAVLAQHTLAIADDDATLDLPQLNELAEFVRAWDELQGSRTVAQRWREWLGESGADGDAGALGEAAQLLSQWLRSPANSPAHVPRWLRLPIIVVAVFVVLGSVVLALTATPAAWLGLLPAAALFFIVLAPRAPAPVSPAAMFPSSHVAPPRKWEPDVVQERLAEIHRELANAQLAAEKRREFEASEPGWNRLTQREAELNEQRRAICERLRCEMDPQIFTTFVEQAREWSDARSAVAQLSARIEVRTQERADVLAEMASVLVPLDIAVPNDFAEARGAIEGVTARDQRWREGRQEIESREREHARLGEQCGRMENDIAAILKLAKVEDADALANLLRDFGDFTNARDAENAQRGLHDAAAGFFRQHAEFEGRAVEEMERVRGEAAERGETVEALIREKVAIETKIQEAKRKTDVEDAVARCDSAKRSLIETRDGVLSAFAGHLVAEYVREQMGELAMPPVFDRAREFFGRFTAHQFELVPPDKDGGFRARETGAGGAGRSLEELSSGTRVQLLLAVRAAFVASEEGAFNVQLPLLLDETLANSDDRRAQQIIEAIAELARDGRQIFYFTAQADEVAKWREFFSRHSDVPHHIADLAVARGAAATADFDRVAAPLPVPAPEPGARSYDEYGALLGVTPFDPRGEIGGVHLWHVCEDSATLHGLLAMGFERWGQFDSVLRRSGRQSFTSDDARLRANARLLDELARHWRHGRGRPLEREALCDGGVSEVFIDRIWEFAGTCDRDAKRLLQGLESGEIERFGRTKIEQLRAHLEHAGFLGNEVPLEATEIRSRLLPLSMELGIETTRLDLLLAKICV